MLLYATIASWWKLPDCKHTQVLLEGLEKGYRKTQTPSEEFQGAGDKWRHFIFCKDIEVSSGFVQAWSSTEKKITECKMLPVKKFLKPLAGFGQAWKDMRISVITQFLWVFIQTLPFPGLHGEAQAEGSGMPAEDMVLHKFTGFLFPMAEEQPITTQVMGYTCSKAKSLTSRAHIQKWGEVPTPGIWGALFEMAFILNQVHFSSSPLCPNKSWLWELPPSKAAHSCRNSAHWKGRYCIKNTLGLWNTEKVSESVQ